MKFGRYLIVMVSSWLFAAAVVVGFILLVDPMESRPFALRSQASTRSSPSSRIMTGS